MKKKIILITAAAAALSLGISAKVSADTDMYRLYNPNSGEHFYTATTNEKDNLVNAGWKFESIGWVAPDSGEPVYRLYNPNAGDHFYTLSSFEKDSLTKAGWNYEGIGWHSGGSVPLYRAYNPNAVAGAHNYTTSTYEQGQLELSGWKNENIGWYGVGAGRLSMDIGQLQNGDYSSVLGTWVSSAGEKLEISSQSIALDSKVLSLGKFELKPVGSLHFPISDTTDALDFVPANTFSDTGGTHDRIAMVNSLYGVYFYRINEFSEDIE